MSILELLDIDYKIIKNYVGFLFFENLTFKFLAFHHILRNLERYELSRENLVANFEANK